jgi:hypothetical protein
VRHHMNGRVVPVDELAIVPDLVGLLNCHANSLGNIIAEGDAFSAAALGCGC